MTVKRPTGWKAFLIYQGPAIAAAAFLFLLSSIPDIPAPKINIKMQDKIGHLLAYAIFAYLLGRAFFYQDRFPGWKRQVFWAALIAGILYGISDEIHQLYVPGRSSDIYDVLADALGSALGAAAFRYRTALRRALPLPH